jgi:hypothetical protein
MQGMRPAWAEAGPHPPLRDPDAEKLVEIWPTRGPCVGSGTAAPKARTRGSGELAMRRTLRDLRR